MLPHSGSYAMPESLYGLIEEPSQDLYAIGDCFTKDESIVSTLIAM